VTQPVNKVAFDFNKQMFCFHFPERINNSSSSSTVETGEPKHTKVVCVRQSWDYQKFHVRNLSKKKDIFGHCQNPQNHDHLKSNVFMTNKP